MSLPRPGSPREEWTDGESLAVELLNLASWLTQRTIYEADRNIRKGVALDETHFLSQVPTGKVLIDRLARDSRKFNVRALFASQLAGDLLRVSGFASLVNAVFVGRTDDNEAQADALRLLKVPVEVGYEQMLGTLSPRPRHDDRPDDTPRQFIFADGHGGVEKIRIDLEAPHLEHVRDALDTNPDASRVAVRGVPAPAQAAAVHAPDEPPLPLTFAKTSPTVVDLADDERELVDPTFDDLDDPDGLLLPGAGNGYRAELLDDEALDLLGDIDEEPAEIVDAAVLLPSDGGYAGRGDSRIVDAHEQGWTGASLDDRFDGGSSDRGRGQPADRPGRRSGETVADRFGSRTGDRDRDGARRGETVGDRFGDRAGGRSDDRDVDSGDGRVHRGERVGDLRPGDRAGTGGRTRR